jgi:hypothetical protein
MALYKPIKQPDGVTTDYHRVLFLTITPNQQNSVAVCSYVDPVSRADEQAGDMDPYRKTITYETDYQENMSIKDAYEYLKTLPEFEGAEDV